MARKQRTPNSDVVKNSEPVNSEKETENQTDTKERAENQSEYQSANRKDNQSDHRPEAPNNPEKGRAVSLKKELQDLERGLSAIERLLDAAQLSLESAEEIALIAELLAISGFIHNRLILVRRMIEGDVDPKDVWTAFNDAGSYWIRPDNTDVVFAQWTVNQRVIYARFQLDLAERMVVEALNREKMETDADDDD